MRARCMIVGATGLSVAASLGACGSRDDGSSVFGDGSGDGATETATSPAETAGPDTGVDSSESGGTDSPKDLPIFDVGSGGDIPGGGCDDPDDPDCHCDAVDLVFVVDNSGSMSSVRDDVVAAFPTFVDEMISALPPGTDLHVGLTRGTGFFDPGNAGGWSGPTCEASITDGSFFPPTDGDNGENGQQGRLYVHQGMNHFAINTNEDPAPLAAWFSGALTGTIDGAVPHSNTETVVAGASYVVHPVNATANDGFLRDDAVLVLFLLSDSPDLTPASVPTSDFIDIVRDAKSSCGGDLCVVTAGALPLTCYENPQNTNSRLTDFLNGFGDPPASLLDLNGFGAPDFTGVLGTALADVISTTCDEITPEG